MEPPGFNDFCEANRAVLELSWAWRVSKHSTGAPPPPWGPADCKQAVLPSLPFRSPGSLRSVHNELGTQMTLLCGRYLPTV